MLSNPTAPGSKIAWDCDGIAHSLRTGPAATAGAGGAVLLTVGIIATLLVRRRRMRFTA